MNLTIYSGSPRGKASNSDTIADMLISSFDATTSISRHNIHNSATHKLAIEEKSDKYFIVFPLYADAMPYAVKLFFEKLEKHKNIFKDKPFYFFIHSGFPEAKQSRLLERYLKYFCKIIDVKCMGICIMGNSEGLRKFDKNSKRIMEIKKYIKELAIDISKGKPFNTSSLEYFKRMETLPKPAVSFLKIFPLINIGFNFMLRKTGAYDKRFNKPYL